MWCLLAAKIEHVHILRTDDRCTSLALHTERVATERVRMMLHVSLTSALMARPVALPSPTPSGHIEFKRGGDGPLNMSIQFVVLAGLLSKR